jgi:hypothetical protein
MSKIKKKTRTIKKLKMMLKMSANSMKMRTYVLIKMKKKLRRKSNFRIRYIPILSLLKANKRESLLKLGLGTRT